MKICKKCGEKFNSTAIIDGERKSLTGRSYCLTCSPWGDRKGYELRRGGNKLDEEEFAKVVEKSTSIRQVLKKLGLVEAGGNYQTIKRQIKLLKLDTSHFTGQGHLRGKKHNWAKKRPLNEILVKDSDYGGSTSLLKKRLIGEGILEPKCYNCQLTEWLGEPAPLELEHINGDRFDNRRRNLTLLCPNCHALTPTYRGRGKKKLKAEVVELADTADLDLDIMS